MKKLLFAALLLTIVTVASAQKEDNVWVFGYRYSNQVLANGIYFNFGDSLAISYAQKPMALRESCASLCDSMGNLLLLSNSCYIETGEGTYIENSDNLNTGYVYDVNCVDDTLGYNNLSNSMLLLPVPDSLSLYYLFHIRAYVDFQPLVAYDDKLFYTKIDMSANGGQGKVLFKNQTLVSDTLHDDGLAAVRHANGRDWWIVVAKTHSNKYYIIHLSPAGLNVTEQSIGEDTWAEAGGEMVFSPDGTKLARFNTRDDLRIFDFDRCTGTLSNPIHIPIQDDTDSYLFAGLAFSADGHYLYASELVHLLQFDMWAADIAGTQTIVAERELNAGCALGQSFFYLELAPDGLIYSRPGNGQSCMHRMKHPERSGTACEFQQYYYDFPYAYKNLPHLPNFRLGPIDGSACDTLGLNNHPLAGWRYDRAGGLQVDFTSVSWYEPDTWLWDFDDPASGAANQSAEHHPQHTFSAPGAYEVCLTVGNQYGSDTKCKTVWVTTVGANAPEEESGIKIFPNPSSGRVFWTGTSGAVTVRLLNSLGQLQLTQTTTENELLLEQLPQGMYILQMYAPDGTLRSTSRISLF